MNAIARAPLAVLRFLGLVAKRIVVGVASLGLVTALMFVLDAALLRDRSGRPPA